MPSLVLIGVSTVLILPLWTILALYRNYKLAQTTQLPLVISPVNPFNPLWILSRPFLNPLLSCLPSPLSSFTRYNYLGWAWRDKNYLHTIYGPAFVIVTPGENQLIVGDANACDDLLKYHRQWPKNAAFNDPLNTFGHNVGTAEGDAWKRQRKITTAAFNERNSNMVWKEAIKQAKQMLRTWLSTGSTGVTNTPEDTSLFALHVLTGAGFGKIYDFESSLKVPSPGHSISYREALRTILENVFITYFIVSFKDLPQFILPRKVKAVLTATTEFKSYMCEMLDQERNAHARESTGQDSMKTSQASSLRANLTDDEIWGNLFIYNLAGHETTASTLAYAIALLACHPEWQEWLQPELSEVFGVGEADEDQYDETFPRMKRCHAILYETLRLYSPLNGIPRHTCSEYKVLQLGSSTHTIPPNTAVFVNNAAVQVDSAIWGSDTLSWRPGRWLQPDPENGQNGTTETGSSARPDTRETPVIPTDRVYIPWGSGPRACPGKKFSQVEFVAALAVLFHRHRVTPVVDTAKGETEQMARERTMRVVADSDMALAMRINHPERLRLRWDRVSVGK